MIYLIPNVLDGVYIRARRCPVQNLDPSFGKKVLGNLGCMFWIIILLEEDPFWPKMLQIIVLEGPEISFLEYFNMLHIIPSIQ